ncbi:Histone deacetylase 19 [Glycine soja]|uniref:Histone deacetylase 19 n=1 Tax=Glycine soja TaxID=3848 RepID=A0A445HQC7_GLYSO|nr:Histone deacetylase 19 [Glycine soja]
MYPLLFSVTTTQVDVPSNVLRQSSQATRVALGIEVDDKMPQHEYYEYFGPDYTVHVAPSNMENKNSRHLLEEIRSKLLENLSKLQHAPSAQFQERPPDSELGEFMRLLIVIIGTMMAMFLVPTQPMDYTSQYPNQNQSQTSGSSPDSVSTSVNRISPSMSHANTLSNSDLSFATHGIPY